MFQDIVTLLGKEDIIKIENCGDGKSQAKIRLLLNTSIGMYIFDMLKSNGWSPGDHPARTFRLLTINLGPEEPEDHLTDFVDELKVFERGDFGSLTAYLGRAIKLRAKLEREELFLGDEFYGMVLINGLRGCDYDWLPHLEKIFANNHAYAEAVEYIADQGRKE